MAFPLQPESAPNMWQLMTNPDAYQPQNEEYRRISLFQKDYQRAQPYPSNNFTAGNQKFREIKYVILNSTPGDDVRALASHRTTGNQCPHYLIGVEGDVAQLVHEKDIAHTFRKPVHWGIDADINPYSLHISLVHLDEGFTEAQYTALLALLRNVCNRNNILRCDVIGAFEVALSDQYGPANGFNWRRLEAEGLAQPWSKRSTRDPLRALADHGYPVRNKPDNSSQVVRAFQRRYVPRRVTGRVCKRTRQKILHADYRK